MNKLELEVEDNIMIDGKALVSLPNNFNGSTKVKRNQLKNVSEGVVVRDEEKSIEKLILEHLKEDTSTEKVKEFVTAIKNLEHPTLDTVTESLFLLKVKQYLKVGTSVVSLGTAILKMIGII